MIRSRRRLSVSALSAVLVLLAVPGPADAGTHRHRDATRDVVWGNSATGGPLTHHDRSNTRLDITGITTTYSATTLTLHTGLRETRLRNYTALWEIGTPAGSYYVQDIHEPSERIAAAALYHDGARVRCRGFHRHIDRRHDYLRFTVPRRCLGRPAWVRTGFTIRHVTGPNRIYEDDAQRDGRVGYRARLGPKVFRA